MIKYKLYCNNCFLTFDSWFGSSDEFEKLRKKKVLNCYSCNSQPDRKNFNGTKAYQKNQKTK